MRRAKARAEVALHHHFGDGRHAARLDGGDALRPVRRGGRRVLRGAVGDHQAAQQLGCDTASPCPTMPPIDRPTKATGPRPHSRISRAASSTSCSIVYGPARHGRAAVAALVVAQHRMRRRQLAGEPIPHRQVEPERMAQHDRHAVARALHGDAQLRLAEGVVQRPCARPASAARARAPAPRSSGSPRRS